MLLAQERGFSEAFGNKFPNSVRTDRLIVPAQNGPHSGSYPASSNRQDQDPHRHRPGRRHATLPMWYNCSPEQRRSAGFRMEAVPHPMGEQELAVQVRLATTGDQDALQRLIVHYHAVLHRSLEVQWDSWLEKGGQAYLLTLYWGRGSVLTWPGVCESTMAGSRITYSTGVSGGCRRLKSMKIALPSKRSSTRHTPKHLCASSAIASCPTTGTSCSGRHAMARRHATCNG